MVFYNWGFEKETGGMIICILAASAQILAVDTNRVRGRLPLEKCFMESQNHQGWKGTLEIT